MGTTKRWLKKELEQSKCSGSMRAMFDTTISLLEARAKWLKMKKRPYVELKLAKVDIKYWGVELNLTEEDEV